MPRSANLGGVTNCCWIHPTLYLKWIPRRAWRDTNQIGFLDRKEASSNSTTINLLKLPKMWRLLMRVEKRMMVLSLVPELTRRNIQHLKDYPVFQVFFFDFRALGVSWSTRYASAQRAELRDSCTAFARVKISKARVLRYEFELQRRAYRNTNELLRGRTNTTLAKKNETGTHVKLQARACSRDHAPVPAGTWLSKFFWPG